MILAKNIHKFYDQLEVLKGVDLHITKGEIVSIVGASGAGKTTLLQILGTLDRPTSNENSSLLINGEDVLKMNDKALSRSRNLNLGFIFQFHQLLPEFQLKIRISPHYFCTFGIIFDKPDKESRNINFFRKHFLPALLKFIFQIGHC